jgi:hypothetical protein
MDEPLYATLSQRFTGEPAEIAAALRGLGEMLQDEVESRGSRSTHGRPMAKLDTHEYLTFLAEQQAKLAKAFEQSDRSFARASGSSNPQVLCRAYAAFLDGFLSAGSALSAVEPPQAFAKTNAAFLTFLTDFYRQVASWPVKIVEAASSVNGNSFDLKLSATHDMALYQVTFAEESATLSEPSDR